MGPEIRTYRRTAKYFMTAAICAAGVTSSGCMHSVGRGDDPQATPTVTVVVAGNPLEVEIESPHEQQFLEAGKHFLEAVIRKDCDAAYQALATHARARMSRNQFHWPEDEAAAKRNEQNPLSDVTLAGWVGLVEACLHRYGQPSGAQRYWVESADPKTLSGTGDPLDVMIAIGGMPTSIPAEIRRAALRASITTELTDEEAKEIADEYGITPEEVMEDEMLAPYFNLKFVLVEEEGELKVGYFEFLPPSMLD